MRSGARPLARRKHLTKEDRQRERLANSGEQRLAARAVCAEARAVQQHVLGGLVSPRRKTARMRAEGGGHLRARELRGQKLRAVESEARAQHSRGARLVVQVV